MTFSAPGVDGGAGHGGGEALEVSSSGDLSTGVLAEMVGAGVLGSATTSAPFFGALTSSEAPGSPPSRDDFDAETGELTDPDLRARFDEILAVLAS